MWGSILLGFLAGVLLGNGIPHFVKGITKEQYPTVFGPGPVPNLIAGWVSLVIVGALVRWNGWPADDATWISTALGLLTIGLFHAGPGAFGRE
jgi:hypothetical protein